MVLHTISMFFTRCVPPPLNAIVAVFVVVAPQALRANRTIGISTGGVAEVFETNSATGDEVIVLQNRKGIVKLAFSTGASLVPCYLFGNTHLLSLWTGGEAGHDFVRRLSRRLGECARVALP